VFRAALTELNGGLTPTLAVVEDAQRADDATLDLLRFLGRRLETARALLVVTYRDDEVALRAALATFERLGARPMAARVTNRLRDLGARGIPRGPRPTTRPTPPT
jgi:hypothetical protein